MNKTAITTIMICLLQCNLFSQKIDNNLLGEFLTTDNSQMYKSFSFNNNGKVTIDQIEQGDYFIKGDTLLIFPNKDIFKFLINDTTLVGVSNWVDKGVWNKTNKITINNRTDNMIAEKNAQLLSEYYQKTRVSINQMNILFDDKLKEQYIKDLEALCDSNLVRACKELFGMETLNQMGGFTAVLGNENNKEITPSNKLLSIAKKVASIDPVEGNNLLSMYYFMLKDNAKGQEYLDKAIALGNKEATLNSINIELAKQEATIEQSKVTPNKHKKLYTVSIICTSNPQFQKSQIPNSQPLLPITHHPSPITHHPSLITHYPSPITHYPSPITL
jgi:DNA-binding Xre family transcriptional regulator